MMPKLNNNNNVRRVSFCNQQMIGLFGSGESRGLQQKQQGKDANSTITAVINT
jgi:hypothetical protein